MSTIKANTLLHSDGSTTTQPSIPALDKRMAKAWVNFNGTGTVAINSAYNVSSITDNGVGQYSVNFGTAMTTANYIFVLGGRDANNGMGIPTFQADPTRSITTSALPVIYNYPPNQQYYDGTHFCVVIMEA